MYFFYFVINLFHCFSYVFNYVFILVCKTTPTAFDTVCKMLEENRYITKFAINCKYLQYF